MKRYRKFCGWDTLLKLIEQVQIGMKGYARQILIHNERELQQGRALIATIFETGARIGEVIGGPNIEGLHVKDFHRITDREVNVIFTIEKRYRKIRKVIKYRATDGTRLRWRTEEEAKKSGHPYEPYEGYETKRVIEIRNIVFPRKEPLVPIMLGWVERIRREKGKDGKLFDFTYNRAYNIIKKAGEAIGEDFPPHRLRAERATQLAVEYDFDDSELTEWFEWKNAKEAHNYTVLAPKIHEKMFQKLRW